MTNIDEIVKALRTCADKQENCESCHTGQSDCPFGETCVDCTERMNRAAADAIEALQAENISLRAERDRARLDCAVAETNHMNTLERFLEAQERIDELKAENTQLRAERNALLKSFTVTSQPIKVIQPKGVVE